MSLRDPAPGVGGWLLLLSLLLRVWHPLQAAAAAPGALAALPVRGWPLAMLLAVRVGVAGVCFAAGIALTRRSPGAVRLTAAALLLSAGIDLVVYLTPIFPNNRMPGDTPYYIAATLLYHAAWLTYLARSRRVAATFEA
jgi:hypothetical protein